MEPPGSSWLLRMFPYLPIVLCFSLFLSVSPDFSPGPRYFLLRKARSTPRIPSGSSASPRVLRIHLGVPSRSHDVRGIATFVLSSLSWAAEQSELGSWRRKRRLQDWRTLFWFRFLVLFSAFWFRFPAAGFVRVGSSRQKF